MSCDRNAMLLYGVTDRKWTGRQTLSQQVESALKGGATCIQLREKELDDEKFLAEALEIRALCSTYKVPFIINDHVELAIKCSADGIHVGQQDLAAGKVRQKIGSKMILGVSAQTLEQALLAEEAGADYLGVGAVFPTDTKLDASEVSGETLQTICRSVSVPVVAIGGISRSNLLKLSGSGVDGVALVSAIFSAEDIETECRELHSLSRKMVEA